MNDIDIDAIARELHKRMQRVSPVTSTSQSWKRLDSLDDVLSMGDAGEVAGLSESMMRSHAAKGHIRAKRLGSLWITTRNEAERFAAERRTRGRPSIYGEGKREHKAHYYKWSAVLAYKQGRTAERPRCSGCGAES